jgi:oxygen-independent coproporphyrinogen-3 oxidase
MGFMGDYSFLFDKYDTPVPRYTSYPPVPSWKNNLEHRAWIESLKNEMASKIVSWSLYMHLPFCESLCTFCACNNLITKDHSKEDRYIRAIQSEWQQYIDRVPDFAERPIRQLHLGGGSPTFFGADSLHRLLEPFFSKLKIDFENFEGAIEIDPRRCTFDQLKVLRDFGFNRISLGVQDFDLNVQKNVNRIQPFEQVENCVKMTRDLGFESVNFDLIYGLPGQSESSIADTARKTVSLKPDRIAIYSLAVVPWLRPAQNRFQKMEIRSGSRKRVLFEKARDIFVEANYVALGIDHFALPSDPLVKSSCNGQLHRNFMGYAEFSTDVLLGLGVSAISETSTVYHQNQKDISIYYSSLEEKRQLPFEKGHALSLEDIKFKRYILDLMTKFSAKFESGEVEPDDFQEMIGEGLLRFEGDELIINEAGKPFARHICHKIDRTAVKGPSEKKYSSGV